jgi:hypothetical protein
MSVRQGPTLVSNTLRATAGDKDGFVSRVEFCANGNLVATDPSEPFESTWSSVGPGVYSITAKAIDNDNAPTTSSPASVTVQ